MDYIITDFAKKIFASIEDIRKKCILLLVSLISGVVTHIYYMVNMPGSDDIIMRNYPKPPMGIAWMLQGASTGRIFGGFIDLIQTWYRSFYVSGWIIIITMAIMTLYVVSIFRIESYVGGILTAIILQVSPSTQANVVLGEISYPVAFLSATIAAYYVTRETINRKQMILGSFLFGVSLLTMPTAMSCYLTLVLLWIIGELIDNTQVDTKYLLGRAWKSIAILVVLGVIVLALCIGIVLVKGYDFTAYQGAEDALTGGFITHIGSNIIQVYKKFIVQGLWKIQIIPKFSITFYIAYIMDAVFMWILCTQNKDKLSGKRVMLAVVGIVLIPVAICTITLVGYSFMYKGQHRLPLTFLILGTIMFSEKVAKHDIKKYGKLVGVFVLDFIMMIYGFFLFDSIGYQVQNYVMQQDASLCTRILAGLDRTSYFSYEDDVVYFLNITSWDKNEGTSPIKYDPALYDVIWPVATTNLYCYKDDSIRAHILNYEGVDLNAPSEDIKSEIEASNLREKYKNLKFGNFAIAKYKNVTVVVVKTVMPPNVLYG